MVTLFHAPSNQASIRVHTMLKQAAATAKAHATEDQASSHAKQSKLERTDFNLDVQEEPPTSDQLSNILEYLGPSNAAKVVKDATGTSDALRKFKASEASFIRPVTVDWNNGKAGELIALGCVMVDTDDGVLVATALTLRTVAGDNESELMQMIKSLPKETDSV